MINNKVYVAKMSLRLLNNNTTKMFRKLYKGYAYSTQVAPLPRWDLVSAVCVERTPVITRMLNPLEQTFQDMLNRMEFEKSLKCDHELRKQQDIKHAELLKKGVDIGEVELDASTKQTAQDFEDACMEELSKFELAPTITAADRTNDLKSLERKLSSALVLLVEQKLGSNKMYLPPQGIRQDGETMRQTAERVLLETCGDNLKVRFFGNAPCGFYKYKYPQDAKEQNKTDSIGAKVFFFMAQRTGGQITKDKAYKWLDRTELSMGLPKQYHHSISQFLIDEDKID